MTSCGATPLEQLLDIAVNRRNVTIGLPGYTGSESYGFPLTPEAAAMLVARGFVVKMETGGAAGIHYHDLKYQQNGVEITSRAEAFRCDIVIYLAPLSSADVRMMKRGAMLLTMFEGVTADLNALRLLLSHSIISIAIDLIEDNEGHHPFADILSEIAGRASMAIASSLLADSVHGKGILLGGIAGIVPCEVTIIGSGIDACAAAVSAMGLGASVRIFDNDIYRLRRAMRYLGSGVSGSAMHPRVLLNALRSADVVVATAITPKHQISADVVAEMKLGVITFDLDHAVNPTFPSLQPIELGNASPADNTMDGHRVCYINPGNAVPRTAAMALSNTFLTMLSDIFSYDGFTNALMLNTGLQRAALSFLGKPVNPAVARMLGTRHVDIKLILQFS